MAELKHIPADVFQVHAYCGECGVELKNTGTILMSNPPQYSHICPNGHGENLDKPYPAVVYRPKAGIAVDINALWSVGGVMTVEQRATHILLRLSSWVFDDTYSSGIALETIERIGYRVALIVPPGKVSTDFNLFLVAK